MARENAPEPVSCRDHMKNERLPVGVEVAATQPLASASERLRAALIRRPAIEGRRHWLTERCVTGAVDGATIWIDVKRRYAGRLYARNTAAVRFRGHLLDDRGTTVLRGEVDYRFPEARVGFIVLRVFAILVAVIAVVIAIEEIATARVDEIAFGLAVVPALLLFVALPHFKEAVDRSAVDDAALLRRFLETTLSAEPASRS